MNTDVETAVLLRSLDTADEIQACLELQRATWGENFGEVVPPSLLRIALKVGGVATGAFDESGALVGFVFGLTGVKEGNIVHWSHMLAVAPRMRNHGIGRRLKEHQRAVVAKLGATTIYWTFDPLVARNAHLNFNVLGVRATEYVENMYGESNSPIHRGIGTDRLVVAWPVADAAVAARKSEIARFERGDAGATFRIEVPSDIETLQATDMQGAIEWRARTRAAFQRAFASGYVLHGFGVDPDRRHAYYLLGDSTWTRAT